MEEVVGFSPKQREWFLERDGHRCQHRHFNGLKWVQCPVTTGLQVHHIIPRGWAIMHLPPSFPINGANNGITLCAFHHVGKSSVHNDTFVAQEAYRQGDKEAYSKMRQRRKELNLQGVPYWNPQWDWMFNRIVKKLNVSFLRKNPYPQNGKRGLNGRQVQAEAAA